MRIFVVKLFSLIAFSGVAQADFIISSGVYGQTPKYLEDIDNNPQVKQSELFLGMGVIYQINEKLSVDQVVTYHFRDNQIPSVRNFDQNQANHYFGMQFLFNYKISPIWEPSVGFRLGSIFLTENFVQAINGFVEVDKNDIVTMIGIKANLNHKLQFHLKQDLIFIQTQEYYGWLVDLHSSSKNRLTYFGISYTPFRKKSK